MAGRVTSASIYAMVCTHRKVDVMLLDLTDVVLVLAIVLKAPEHLQYQLAFLSTVGGNRLSLSSQEYLANCCHHRNSMKFTRDRLSAVNRPNPRTMMARGKLSKATVPFASWSLSPPTKRSSGVNLHAGITSTRLVSTSGQLPSARRESAASTGESHILDYCSC